MYAVEPSEVRRNSESLTSEEIASRVKGLKEGPDWVVLSGGNPALHDLGNLVGSLHEMGRKVAVETQGSVWRPWLADVDRLTISPKPPSSNMATEAHRVQLDRFMSQAKAAPKESLAMKIVCFDEEDLLWAKGIASSWPEIDLFLSAGTPVPSPTDLRSAVAARFRWLCEKVAEDPELAQARVLPQLHVIAWADTRGV